MTTQNIRVANGNRVQPVGEVEVALDFGTGIIYQHVIVAETEEPLVLGNDFLFENDCTIDICSRNVSIRGQKVTCHLEDELPSLFRIKLRSDSTIPANCEKILPAYIQIDDSAILPSSLLVEGSEKLLESKGLVVGRVLVNSASKEIPVRILNPSEQEVKLFRETTLGHGHRIEVVNPSSVDVQKCFTLKPDCPRDKIPEHLNGIWSSCQKNLTAEQQTKVQELLVNFRDSFAETKSDLGHTTLVEHRINTGTAPPIKQRPRRLPLAKRQVEKEEVHRMLKNGIIEPSSSPWASPIVMATKKDGTGS